MLISLGRISRHFFSPSQFDPLLRCCCKVRLWRDGREIHTCLCLAIDILLTPFFSPHLHHPISSPSPLFLLSQWVRGGQSILTPSTGQVRTSNILWIHTFSACTQAGVPVARPLLRSVFPPVQPHINLTILSFSLFTFPSLSLWSVIFDVQFLVCSFACSTAALRFPL